MKTPKYLPPLRLPNLEVHLECRCKDGRFGQAILQGRGWIDLCPRCAGDFYPRPRLVKRRLRVQTQQYRWYCPSHGYLTWGDGWTSKKLTQLHHDQEPRCRQTVALALYQLNAEHNAFVLKDSQM